MEKEPTDEGRSYRGGDEIAEIMGLHPIRRCSLLAADQSPVPDVTRR